MNFMQIMLGFAQKVTNIITLAITTCSIQVHAYYITIIKQQCDTEECQKDGASFAKLHMFTAHFRTSAKTGEGIEEAVGAAVKEVRM